MRAVVVAAFAAACGTTPHPPRAPAPAAAPAEPAAAPLTEAELKQKSYAVLLAYDHADVRAFEAATAPELWHWEGGKPRSRAEELATLAKRRPGAPAIARRTWEDESVQLGPDRAVFIGKATEIQGGNESKGGYRYVGWYLLEWGRHGGDWKLRLWTWQRGGDSSLRDGWNDIFRNGVGYNREPNALLVETVRGKRPGTALDVAMGQGRNALFLASQGWKVTGVDISDEGIRLAREEADRKKLTLQTVNTNIDGYDFGTAKWDLVTMIYAGNDTAWIEKIKPSLKKGGLFVVEYFAHDPEMGHDDGFQRGQLAKLFPDGYTILRDDLVEGVPDWAMDRAKLVRFVARKD